MSRDFHSGFFCLQKTTNEIIKSISTALKKKLSNAQEMLLSLLLPFVTIVLFSQGEGILVLVSYIPLTQVYAVENL